MTTSVSDQSAIDTRMFHNVPLVINLYTGWQNSWGIFRGGRIWQNSLTNQAWSPSILSVDTRKGSTNEHVQYLRLEEGIHAITAIKKCK